MKDLIILVLLGIAASWGSIVGPKTVSISKDEIKQVLKIEEPTESVLDRVDNVKGFEIEQEDALKLAVFNNSFASRIEGYNITSQEVNDLYVQSAKNMFGTSLKGKYAGYSTFVTSLIKECYEQEKSHELSDLEKEKLSELFEGLAWVLLWTE